jgi:TonB family protein
MNMLLVYVVKVAVYLIALYIVYSILLSRDTSYGRNRAFILLSLVTALILPLITLNTIKPLNIQFFEKFLPDVFVTADSDRSKTITSGLFTTSSLQIIYTIYIIGVIFLVFKLIVDLLNLLFLISRQKKEGSRIIRFHGFHTAGFSAMGYIFISTRLKQEEAAEIIKHEQNHLKQNHFIDIIFIETIKAFQWFNPVVYLFNRSLRAIHEYQADQECLSSGIPVVNYQNLLLNQVFKSGAFNLTNSFSNPSLVKKRMIMMTKKRTSGLANMKLLLVVPVIALVFLTISGSKADINTPQTEAGIINIPSQPSEAEGESETTPFVVVEEMPMFPGGDEALLKFIGANTTYPEIAKKNNIQGRVVVRFCVTEKGTINKISILKGVDPSLDAEALRVVKSLPVFNPGKQGGKTVPVWYMVPITFTLN